MRKLTLSAVQLLVVLLLHQTAHGQVAMEQVFIGQTDSGQWNFHALDCFEDHCTAVGSIMTDEGYTLRAARSDDQGRTWRVQGLPLPNEIAYNQPKLRTVDQINADNIVIGGDSGLLLRTYDGGSTWNIQYLPFPTSYSHNRDIIAVSFVDSAHGIAVGPAWLYFYTSDGGVTWNVKPTPAYGSFSAVLRTPSSASSLRYGVGIVYRTNDNGDTWDSTTAINLGVDTSFIRLPRVMKYLSDDTIVVGGQFPYGRPIGSYDAYIARTTNGGQTWQDVYIESSVTPGGVLSVSDPVDGLLLAGGQQGNLLVSSDRGASWYKDTLLYTAGQDVSNIHGWSGGRFIGISYADKELRSSIYAGDLHTAGVNLKDYLAFRAQVFPNPSSSQLSIRTATPNKSVAVVDMLGRELLRTTLDATGAADINVRDVPSGLYAVVALNGGAPTKIANIVVLH
jgi:photosystem II stability/assembly factor-like uncharacterized protein